ncbi:IclR family transcriptional regulator [Pseudarthrobacter phenanthrenivorans]|uniref:IclR family transcriptional regulator n=1 Tax=Pseudarthrobacter phenanthrenivorans TaxID=361575 RepID=A0A3B0FJE2_PSEPS|nr:IclR family transcriptional regulator [Pseudarthrobacter phenanthrenivorans]RKO19975.1 IclR family transcriptional regulator [Pseudarthrobacter phenanthrenivorans]
MGRLTPALMRAFDILELLRDADNGLSASEIVEKTGLPRTTVHELLITMVERKYLRRDEAAGRFHLGIVTFQLGNAFAERLDLRSAALRVAQRVAAECDETVQAGILDGGHVVYLCKVDSTQAVRTIARTGGRLPANCTAIGKAMLAFLPKSVLSEMAQPGALTGLTPKSITDPAHFMEQMLEIQQTGVAFESGESNLDVSCVAAPVRDHAGVVRAAISISVPDMRWYQRSEQEWAELALDGARQLGSELGAA